MIYRHISFYFIVLCGYCIFSSFKGVMETLYQASLLVSFFSNGICSLISESNIFYNFIYLFLVVLDLCCVGRVYSLVALPGLLIVVSSLVEEHRL